MMISDRLWQKGELLFPFLNYYSKSKCFCVLAILFVVTCFITECKCNESVSVSGRGEFSEDHPLEIISTDHITEACINKCPEENRINLEHLNVGCGKDCYMKQKKFSKLRSLTLEALSAKAHFPCLNRTNGCKVRLPVRLLNWHESQCVYKMMKCFIGKIWGECDFSCREIDWKAHIEEQHKDKIFTIIPVELIWNLKQRSIPLAAFYVIQFCNEMFYLYQIYDQAGSRVMWTVTCISRKHDVISKFAFEIEIYSPADASKKLCQRYPCHSENDKDILQKGTCVALGMGDILRFVNEDKCSIGCSLWELALDSSSSCQIVCNKTDGELLEPKELYCVMGCNDALSRYFKWLRSEVGTPPAPALVADTLTATSLSLEWEIPLKLLELTKGKPNVPKSYLVQWRYEEVVGDWKFCRNQSMGDNSTVKVENLQPYTKYRFRVALPLSPNSTNVDEVLVSEQSVIISTLAKGVPLSEPSIVRVVAVDHSRISVSWEPGPFPNGPILSYVLQIKALSSEGYSAIKDIAASENTNSYMFDKLEPSTNYEIMVSMRNSVGEGPAAKLNVTTPIPPPVNDDEPEPRLILAAEYTILSQGSDILSEPSKDFYKSNFTIFGIAIHIGKQLIFVSDQAGYVNRAPLEQSDGEKEAIISPNTGLNFFPTLLSMDWLNDHLYILGEVVHPDSQCVWQISRCDLNGRGLTVAIAGLQKKPNHIQVDPFNGYLFWVITGNAPDTGLFRLDLADISNGVKHEVKPDHIIRGGNLGAFVVDYTKFKLLVPPQNENTIISVNLNGEEREDIRKNTQSPKLNLVKSLAMANGIFYWTNGSDLFMEDHHKEENYYYHNAYPNLSNGSFFAVCVNTPSAQPIPVPKNPPRQIQALLSARKAKISWRIPYRLGYQGAGAWQEWYYELEIIDGTSVSNIIRNIKGTYFTVDNLKPNTNYTFRAAAYTTAGKGPWCTEFCAKTLKSNHDRSLIWSSSDGLLESDVIGENIHTLISKTELGEHDISDIAWFEDVLFFVSNSTLKSYNRTSRTLARFGDFDSVESIAIDWIGKRIYWSNPTQQLITRSSLNGLEKETLPILAVVRELKIDSLHGHIYYSTGHAVEVCRLNGKNRMKYFSDPLYSGKRVMGLTLDMDNERILWIVRSYEGSSSLFTAPMANKWNKDIIPIETTLEEKSLNGPLTHFSDRLLWLQDDHTVIVGDMYGRNLAHIRNSKLNGLRSVSVVDPTHHIYPNLTNDLNVIPEKIDNSSIRIVGTWKSFNITWDPVRTVTYGDIFYELRIHSKISNDSNRETTQSSYHYTSHSLPPYTLLDITLRAFTYWGSSKPSSAHIYSPAAAPSVPTKPRVFITYYHDPYRKGLEIKATFRWYRPSEPNGPIIGYRIFCWYEEDGMEKHVCDDFLEGSEQIVIPNLVQNVTYYFQVQAFTSVEGGQKTRPIKVNSNNENPIPTIIAATHEHILLIDADLNQTKIFVHTGNLVNHLSYMKHENRLLWINENRELISFSGNGKTKIAFIQNEVLSFTIDWIERIVYWSQMEQNEKSAIYCLDLNRFEVKPLIGDQILLRSGIIRDLIVLPISQSLFWLEYENKTSNVGILMTTDIEFKRTLEYSYNLKCLKEPLRRILLDTSSLGENKLILISESGKIFSFGFRNQLCELLKINYDKTIHRIVKDSGHWYFMNNNTIITYNYKQTDQYIINITQLTDIFAYYQNQNYPPRRCLLPKQNIKSEIIDYIPELVKKTENSLLLQLPQLESHPNCSIKLPGIKYTIKYAEVNSIDFSECKQQSECKMITAYETLTEIGDLKAFTKYQILVGVNNFYGEQMGMKTIYGPIVIFSTAPGAPSSPRNITAETISPTEVIVQWLQPLELNSDSLWYEVHWQTENPLSRVVNRQQRLVTLQENLIKNSTEVIAINVSKLLPNQKYSIWIQAYSTNNTYSVSPIVELETFSEPDNITVVETKANSLRLQWKSHMNISRYIFEYVQATTTATTATTTTTNNGNSDNWIVVIDSDHDTRPVVDHEYFIVSELQPKTMYKFSLRLYYAKRDIPYIWPIDNRFIFETLGDRPGPPGKPVIHHVSGDVYKAYWETAKENGAPIEEYSLESLLSRISNRIIRSTKDQNDNDDDRDEDQEPPASRIYLPDPPSNYTILQNQIPWAEELDPIEDKWIVQYNGTDSYWIIKDLQPINKYAFRVRARNSYGWGPYSSTSEPISEPYFSPEPRDSLFIVVIIPFMVVILCVIFAGCTIFVVQKRSTAKKLLHETSTRLPDVELANLRELPRGANFIHTSNILYCPGPLTDADLSLLPQIRRDQITMSSFLGSGAFGEVYEGVVHNVGDCPETRVAIKTLRKGATEQEKGEFLQEAQLMSNFKHEHILKLIGVCFDPDSLYIIMELMQGGDLLSYLRSSRPTLGTPSSLILLDLISMCVDVASGCRYLEEMHFVHRDLACRNCLVTSVDPQYRIVKIGDFGLTRDIYKNDYYRKEGEGLLPVRWMSPESLVDGVFTSQSDIWAFGVLCWEIMTLGQQPYPARNNVEVLHYVRDGGRLGRPADCPEELYQLMLNCWSYCPEDRPTFKYCLEVLQFLKINTNDRIQITAANRIGNGGIFNPSYLGSDVNHNQPKGTLKFSNDGSARENLESPIIITPTSSIASTIIPKYLELLYDENEDHQPGGSIQPSSATTLVIGDEYEIPLQTSTNQDIVTCVVTTGCPASRIYSRSNSPNLGNNLGQYNQINGVQLTVALPPSMSSSDEESIQSYSNKDKIRMDKVPHQKPLYSNTSPKDQRQHQHQHQHHHQDDNEMIAAI